MFKKFLLVCIGVMTAMSTMAQVTVKRDYSPQEDISIDTDKSSAFVMKYGIKAGVNMTTMSNKMSFDPGFSMGIGFRAGGFLNMRWGQRTENSLPGTGVWGFQPEVMYSYQAVNSTAGNVTMNFVSLPLLLKIYPTTSLSLEVGPELSYMFLTSPAEMMFDKTIIKVGDCKGANIGVAAGVAYDFEKGFTIGARYAYCFNKMAKNLEWKNSNIQVSLGWMF